MQPDPPDSVLDAVHRLKDQIRERGRLLSAKTGELVAAREYLRRVFAALTDAVLVFDARGKVEFANQSALELLGTSAEALLGLPGAELWVDPEEAAAFREPRYAELLTRGHWQRSECVLRAPGGARVPVQWSASVLELAGRPVGLVGVARDGREARGRQEAKVRAIQELAASVAHEIRNPLGAIQNSLALLGSAALEGEDKTLLEIARGETRRIGQIVDTFMTFARPALPQLAPVALGELAEEVTTLARQDPRARAGRAVVCVVDAALPPARCDPDQIKQVLWNLLINALDAARSRVAVRVRSDGERLSVRIADDGAGIPPSTLARVFDPFHTTKPTGTGLGLPIARRIVEAHGGALRLESVVGAGVVATVTLPRSMEELAPPASEEAR
ncbi:MAG: PAS domain-containing protein [Planctomycetes bacterium]|nr:PAS domain-containing protein [Planctomycetota bacterium]